MEKRYDFVYLFDVKDGNPNGDPDAGNLPRVDPETGHGLVTDVCLKRKIRNFVGLYKGERPPFEIYVKERAVLNSQHARAYEFHKLKSVKKNLPKEAEDARKVTSWMCDNFYDVRTFGAVMSTEVNCGQVRGPAQLTFGRSVEPVVSLEHTVTRCAVTTEKEAKDQAGGNRTMGRKFSVPYGLYRTHGYLNAHLAAQTGFDRNGEDLELLWMAFAQMFEADRSASRGEMAGQALVVFEHDSALGNAPAHKLFERVRITRTSSSDGGDLASQPARSFSDYELNVDEADLPSGVSVIRRI